MGLDFGEEGAAYPRRTYEELLASEGRYRAVVEQSPLAIHVFAPDGTTLLANAAWDELWYLREGEEPEGTNILDEEQVRVTGLLPYVKRAMSGGTAIPPPLFFDPAKTGHEGRPRWLQPFVYPVEDEAGRVREVTLIIEDVTERKRLEEKLSYRADHDALTGALRTAPSSWTAWQRRSSAPGVRRSRSCSPTWTTSSTSTTPWAIAPGTTCSWGWPGA